MKLNIPFYTNTGEKQEALSIEVAERFSKLNSKLINQAIYVENNNILIKAGKTKTKSEVSGGGRKPWKQKGTGRARAGSNRSPLWRGGGITFGPTGENRVLTIPKKMRETALYSLLFSKVKDNEIAVIDNIKIASGKTKDAAEISGKIADSKLVVLAIDNDATADTLAWRNIPVVDIKRSAEILLADLNSKKKIVFTKKAFDALSEKVAK